MAAVKRACRAPRTAEQALDSRDGAACFSSERDPQDSVSVQEERDLGSGEHCKLSSSVNKLSISRSKKTLFYTASGGWRGLGNSALPRLYAVNIVRY